MILGWKCELLSIASCTPPTGLYFHTTTTPTTTTTTCNNNNDLEESPRRRFLLGKNIRMYVDSDLEWRQ